MRDFLKPRAKSIAVLGLVGVPLIGGLLFLAARQGETQGGKEVSEAMRLAKVTVHWTKDVNYKRSDFLPWELATGISRERFDATIVMEVPAFGYWEEKNMKWFTLELEEDGLELRGETVDGKTMKPMTIKVFFAKDGKDNPGKEKYPNWFYYWRQGAVPHLERFAFDPSRDRGEYECEGKRLIIGRGDAGAIPSSILEPPARTIAGKGLCTPQRIESPATEGIDSVARVVAHELTHERLMKETNCGKTRAVDRDGDGVRDRDESSSPYCLDSMNDDTHGLRAKVPGLTAPDNELLAIAAEGTAQADHRQDWACPGSQCKGGQVAIRG